MGKTEDVLKAVLVADSFNRRFGPLTQDTPRVLKLTQCLLPLLNVPLLEYTLEFLASNKVDQILIITCSQGTLIADYIKNSRWSNSATPHVQLVTSQHYSSIGDVMRDLDEKHLITSDFILVNGCLMANVDLKPIIDLHKSKRQKNKNMIMTTIFRQAHQHHPSRSRREGQLYFLDSETNQILFYEPFQRGKHKRKVILPNTVFNDYLHVAAHNDLIDCQIDICSPEVPPLFTEK
jgi:translation initiation factor eIF-2B subunit epsilon